MTPSGRNSMERLQQALDVYLRATADPALRERLLRENPDLQDLLQPMLDPDPAEDAPGTLVLGDFRIERELGSGGMGTVYEAVQLSLGRKVALKVLPFERMASPGAVARFHREAATVATLDHPGIVKVIQSGVANGTHFLALELVPGTPLSRIMSELSGRAPGSLDAGHLVAAALPHHGSYVAAAVDIALQVARALAHAHARGVVHRDVKPGNILVRQDGSAVLTDFGLARLDTLPALTASGGLPGTPAYMAPELLQRRPARVDQRCDLFSLGVTLYEMLTLRRPFEGETSLQVVQEILSAEPVDPARLNAAVPDDLVAIVLKTLEKDPARRYQSAETLAADLEAFLAYRPVAARRPSPWQRLQRWARREPWKARALAVVFVAFPLVTALGGFLVAKMPELHAGASALQADRLEDALDEGYYQLLDEGSRAQARSAFRRALALEPGHEAAVVGLVYCCIDRDARTEKPFRAALEELDRLVPARPRTQVLRRLEAVLLNHTSDTAKAKELAKDFAGASTALERLVVAQHYLWLGHKRKGKYFEPAVTMLTQAMLTSDRPRRFLASTWAHAISHTRDAARAIDCEAVLKSFWPDSARTWLLLGHMWREIEPAKALERYRSATRLAPDSGEAWIGVGRMQTCLGQHAEARRALDHALTLAPVNAGAWHAKAQLDAIDGAVEAAVTALQRACELEPAHVEHRAALGLVLAQQGSLEGARACLAAARASDGGHPLVQLLEGRTLMLQDQPRAALQHLRVACEQEPMLVAPRFFLAKALAADGDRAAAEREYRAALKLAPWHVQTHVNLGLLLLDRDALAEAEREFRAALAVGPRFAPAHHGLLRALERQGKTDERHEAAREFCSALPECADAWRHRATVSIWFPTARHATDSQQALAAAERAFALEPKDLRNAYVRAEARLHAGDPAGALEAARVCRQLADTDKAAPRDLVEQVPIREQRYREALATRPASRPASR